MANVFTKKHNRPRTTTLSDFAGKGFEPPAQPRILSPTRRCNPHPTGLVYQSPYNRDNMTFDIWQPDTVKISRRMPKMLQHLGRINFCSGSLQLPPLHSKHNGPPTIEYKKDTIARKSYQTPCYPENFKHMTVKTTRYGYSPWKPARGIVPTSSRAPPRVQQK